MSTKSGLTEGSANGGGTNIVTEYMKALPLVMYFWMPGVPQARLDGESGCPRAWRLIILLFIAKCQNPDAFKAFRGTALLERLPKLFAATLRVVRSLMSFATTFAVLTYISFTLTVPNNPSDFLLLTNPSRQHALTLVTTHHLYHTIHYNPIHRATLARDTLSDATLRRAGTAAVSRARASE